MTRIFAVLQLVCAALMLATCERSNMYNLTKYGLPPQSAIYLFSLHPQSGTFGDRQNVDSMCSHDGYPYYMFVNASTVKAFVSFSAVDELRFLVPIQYWYFPVVGISTNLSLTTISSSWIDLLRGVSTPINSAVGPIGNFWTGSNSDGSMSDGYTCSGWKDFTGTLSGRFGNTLIDNGFLACSDSTVYVLCLAY